jgi:glutamate-1-semialdehyde 2,1-aminomutase
MNTSQSAKYHAESSQYLALGVSSGMRKVVTDPPLFFDRADGPYYFDVDGNKLLDHTLAWGPLILGSNHPQLNQAVIEALQKSYTLGAQHPGEIALAKRMTEVVPGVEQVIFSNTGTEAIQTALRLARTQTGRTKFIKFEGHYHGWANNILLSYHATEEEAGNIQSPNVVPSMGGQPASEFAEAIVLPWNRLDLLQQTFETHGDDIAAVFTEPLLANSGSIEPVDGFLQGLVDLCKKHGALSVFDEVITGFRLALGGAREFFGVIPDVSVYAKALAAGFTLSAVAGRKALFDVLRDGRTIHAGTYNGNTVSLAAGKATIDILAANPDNHNRMHLHGLQIRKTLEEEAQNRGIALCTSGAGTVFNAHFGTETPPTHYREYARVDMDTYTRFRARMLDNGVQLLPDGRWYVGLSHTSEELSLVQEAIHKSFQLL